MPQQNNKIGRLRLKNNKKILFLSTIISITIIGYIYTNQLIGIVRAFKWHVANSSTQQFNNIQFKVPKFWWLEERDSPDYVGLSGMVPIGYETSGAIFIEVAHMTEEDFLKIKSIPGEDKSGPLLNPKIEKSMISGNKVICLTFDYLDEDKKENNRFIYQNCLIPEKKILINAFHIPKHKRDEIIEFIKSIQ